MSEIEERIAKLEQQLKEAKAKVLTAVVENARTKLAAQQERQAKVQSQIDRLVERRDKITAEIDGLSNEIRVLTREDVNDDDTPGDH